MDKILKAHQPCSKCGSSDALTIYESGNQHCFSCNNTIKGSKVINNFNTKEVKKEKPKKVKFYEGKYIDMPSRKINKNTCEFYDYKISNDNRQHLMSYRNSTGKIVCQKTRNSKKEFRFLGDINNIQLFGQHTCIKDGGQLIITEGEIDAMSINQTFNNKLNVVSVPMGAQSAVKHIKNNYDFVNSYSEIVLAFDQDEPGQEAFEKVKDLFAPGKIKKVNFPEGAKDANDLLQEDQVGLLVRVIKNAQLVRPDSIVSSMDLDFDDIYKAAEGGIPFKYPKLQDMTMGVRGGEVMMLTAGSGIGKSTTAREIAYDFVMNQDKKVGMIFLEEQVQKTSQAFLCLDLNIPLKKFRQDPTIVDKEVAKESFNNLFGEGNIIFYNHFGSLDSKNLIEKIRYMRIVEGVDVVFLDHISIVVSGSRLNDERKELDIIMTELKSLAEETGLIIVSIVHLKRSTGTSFNEGGQVSLNDLRGSASLEQLSDIVIGIERNQQSEESNKMQIRVLKSREAGETGLADNLYYNRDTGRIDMEDRFEAENYGFEKVDVKEIERKLEVIEVKNEIVEDKSEEYANDFLSNLEKELSC